MGAFSFLGGSKKTQQVQRSQASGQAQLSPLDAQDGRRSTSTINSSYPSSSLNSRRSPTPLSSPAHSTASFFSSSRSTTPKSAHPFDTPSSYQSSFDSRAESPLPTPPPKKSRPSLNIIRGGGIPRLSISKDDVAELPVPSMNNTKARSPIYMRFGFSKSSTNIPPEVTTPLTTEAKTTRRRRNTKDSKYDGDSEDARSLVGSRPSSPSRLVPPLPASPPAIFEPTSLPARTLSSSTSFPTIYAHHMDDVAPSVPPKDDSSTAGLEVLPDDDAQLSTSLLLQRRRAKSLGNPIADETGGAGARTDPAHRITNIRLPGPVYPPLPSVIPTPTGTTLTLSQRVSSRSSSPTTSRTSTPATETTIPAPRTPMTATASLCSGSSRARSESSCDGSSRTRSESGCSGPSPLAPFARTRSESGSSRARSESNASSVSSRRNSSKAKQRVTMIKMEDLWGEFLKEVDEDMHDLCTTPTKALQDGRKAGSPAANKVFREKPSSPPPLPRSGSQNDLRKPLSTTSATFAALPSPSVFLPSQRSRGKTVPVAATVGKDEEAKIAHDSHLPQTPPLSIKKQDANSQNVNNNISDAPHIPFLPSLPSTQITIVQPEDSDSASADTTHTINSPKPNGSPSSLPYLYSPDPSASAAGPQPMDFNRNSTYSTHSVQSRNSVNSTFSFADSARPDSTCSEFSQFSLSLFPSPPSVPVIRPTTKTGTFRVGPPSPPTADVDTDSQEEEANSFPFKSILARPSDPSKQDVRERNEPPSAWNTRRTNLRPKAGISTSRYSSLFLDQASTSSDADSTLPSTPTSILPSAMPTTPTTPVTPTASTNKEVAKEGPESKASPTRASKKANTRNYDALLRSMNASFPVASVGGNAGSRPGTADGKCQEWGYAF